MSLWPSIIITLIFQEFATTAAVFVAAHQQNFPLWPIHIIYVVTTVIDMAVGYWLGKFVRRNFNDSRFARWADKVGPKLRKSLGEHGEGFSLTVLAIIDYPYINTFIAAWFNIPMRAAFLFTFIGNAIWYIALWLAIFGAISLFANPTVIIVIILVAGGAFHVVVNLWPQIKKAFRRGRR